MGVGGSSRRLALGTLAVLVSPASAHVAAMPRVSSLVKPRVAARWMTASSSSSSSNGREEGKRIAASLRKANLFGLSDDGFTELMSSMGEKKFRAKQVREWLYGDAPATSIDDMSNLSKGLRNKLKEHASFGELEVAQEQVSKDGTRKRLWRCHDGSLIESVLMPYQTGRRTACISSQVGCAMGCTFCATGQMGFSRHLSEDEIFEQAARFASELRAKDERLSNIVFMGMGEPFRNYDSVMGAARRIMKDLGIGARHITISTVGLVPQIRQFADECKEESLQISLAISLHESNDKARSAIMPVNRKHNLDELISACKYYVQTSGRRISFEWALIAGQNDDAETARDLAKRLKGLDCHVNLIPLNPTKGFDGRPSSLPDAEEFISILAKHKIPATVRVRRGIDIDAGCGQLADAASKDKAAERLEIKLAKAGSKAAEETLA